MIKALYALSADPIHYGHMDIIERASKIFDKVIVGVAVNPEKNYAFTLEERLDMTKEALNDFRRFRNVKVIPVEGLLADYLYENCIDVVVKGIRNAKDCDDELLLHRVGEDQQERYETLLMPARKDLAHISSTVVKAVQREQGLVHEYVPLAVKEAVEARISKQYFIGITGAPGVGKSYIGECFEEIGRNKGVPVHNMELDRIARCIYFGNEPEYDKVRERIVWALGYKVGGDAWTGGTFVCPSAIRKIVFKEPEKLKRLNEIMRRPILTHFRREVYGKKGVILVNAALIAEAGVSYLCNNKVILVNTDKKTQMDWLKERELSEEELENLLNSQMTAEEKKKKLEERIKENRHGTLWEFENEWINQKEIEELFEKVTGENKWMWSRELMI